MQSPTRSAKYPLDKFPPLGPGIVIIKSKALNRRKGAIEFFELFSSLLHPTETYHELRIDRVSCSPQVASWPDENSAKNKKPPSSAFFINRPISNVFVRERTRLVIVHASKQPRGVQHISDEIILEFPTPNECYEWEAAAVHALSMHVFPELTCGRVIVRGAALISFLQMDQFESVERTFELKLDELNNARLVQLESGSHPQRIFLLNGADWESSVEIRHPCDANCTPSTEVPVALMIKNARDLAKQGAVDIILEFIGDTREEKSAEADKWAQAIKYTMDLFEDQDPDAQLRNQVRATTEREKQAAILKKAPTVLFNDSIADDEPTEFEQHKTAATAAAEPVSLAASSVASVVTSESAAQVLADNKQKAAGVEVVLPPVDQAQADEFLNVLGALGAASDDGDVPRTLGLSEHLAPIAEKIEHALAQRQSRDALKQRHIVVDPLQAKAESLLHAKAADHLQKALANRPSFEELKQKHIVVAPAPATRESSLFSQSADILEKTSATITHAPESTSSSSPTASSVCAALESARVASPSELSAASSTKVSPSTSANASLSDTGSGGVFFPASSSSGANSSLSSAALSAPIVTASSSNAAAALAPESARVASPSEPSAAATTASALPCGSACASPVAASSTEVSTNASPNIQLHPTESNTSQLLYFFIFVLGFVCGLFLLGPSITGVRQYGPFEFNVSLPIALSSLHFQSISTAVASQLARFDELIPFFPSFLADPESSCNAPSLPEMPAAASHNSDEREGHSKPTSNGDSGTVASAPPSEFGDSHVAEAGDQSSFVLDRDELDSWSLV